MNTQTNIIIRFQMEGFHNFPKAAELFPEVSFLAERHRHVFHFECEKKVYHDDRDVEFIMFQREVHSWLIDKYGSTKRSDYNPFSYPLEFGAMSCEAIARKLLEFFDLESCTVSEDGENAAKIFVI